MTALPHLCGVAEADAREVWVAPLAERPLAERIRSVVAANAGEGYALLEPDIPLAKLVLPREPVDRAVLALVVRHTPRALLFVRGTAAKLAKVKEERALHLVITQRAPFGESALAKAASAILAEQGPLHGKELLRLARARAGAAGTQDGAALCRAVVRAWALGLVDLAAR